MLIFVKCNKEKILNKFGDGHWDYETISIYYFKIEGYD